MDQEMRGTELATYCLILTADLLADFRYALENIGNDGVSVQVELSLKRDKSVVTKQRHGEHTLNTCRSLFRSEFHATITSESFLERRNRVNLPPSLRFLTSFCISSTVLRSGAS